MATSLIMDYIKRLVVLDIFSYSFRPLFFISSFIFLPLVFHRNMCIFSFFTEIMFIMLSITKKVFTSLTERDMFDWHV